MSLFDSMKKIFSPKEGEDRESLSKKVQVSPQDPQARQKLGFFLLRQGEVVEGLDQLARAAIMYEKDGFAGKAVAILRHMLKQDPSNVDFLRWLIRLLSQEGLTGDALREVENVISRHGFFASEDQKLEFLRNASECLPKSPQTFLHIADIYRAQRKFHSAIVELEKAAGNVREAGMAGEFFEKLSAVRRAAGDDTEILEACGFLLARVGKITEAVAILSNTIERTRLDGKTAEADGMERVLDVIRTGENVPGALSFRVAAEMIAKAEKAPEPAEEAKTAPERASGPATEPASPASPPPAPAMPKDSREDEESIVQDALSRLQAKVTEEIGDSDPDARYNLGIAFKEMGLLDEAEGEFRLARGKQELFVGASSLLAETLAAKEKYSEAIATLGEVLSSGFLTESERRDVRYHMADLLARGGKEEEANRIFLEIFREAPGYRDIDSRTKTLRG